MSITNAERDQLIAIMGCGLFPVPGLAGGPTGSPIAQTIPYWAATTLAAAATGVMNGTAIYLPQGVTIRQITVAVGAAAGTPTDFWLALYDDGRGSSVANQLALLGQTSDNTGARGANTLLTGTMITPFTTQYAGIYYAVLMDKATTPSSYCSTVARSSTALFTLAALGGVINTGSPLGWAAGSGLSTTAPNPSGTITVGTVSFWCLVSS